MGRGHLIRPLAGLAVAVLALPAMPAGVAQAAAPMAVPAVSVSAVNVGAGNQADAHVSGDWVAYTDDAIEGVRFQNLAVGSSSDTLIPLADASWDSLSDIGGNTIVFMRVGGGVQGIDEVQIDAAGNAGPAVEVAPAPDAPRRRPAVGGDTIAFEERHDLSTAPQTEIALADASDPAAPAYRLTVDTVNDAWPAVSPDGNAVVWVKCASTSDCDVWRAERTEGAWGAPEQVTVAGGDESLPDTNGPVTVYASNAGGDDNIRWSVKGPDGYVESVLDLPGVQRNPSIAGHFISFESAPESTQFDVYLYDLESAALRRLTDTSVSECLSEASMGTGGVIRVVWTEPKPTSPYDLDVYALTVPEWIPPTISAAVSGGTMGDDGWYTSPVTVHFTCSDEGSGIPDGACPPDELLEAEGDAVSSTARTVTDGAGNVSAPANVVTAQIDRTAPSGSIVINDGAAQTDALEVSLGLAASDATSGVAGMRLADTSEGLASAPWEAVVPSRAYTLPGGDGRRTVYVEFRDAAGNVSATASDDIVVATAPTPIVTILDPAPGLAIQDRYTFSASAAEDARVSFSIRADDGSAAGRRIGLEHLAATQHGTTFGLAFQTWRLPDGRYLLVAQDADGAVATTRFRIANLALDRLVPATAAGSRAGDTVGVTFGLTTGCRSPFVANEGLTIVIRAKGSAHVLQRATYGPGTTDYAIDPAAGTYTTRFATRATPGTYVVEVWRQTPVLRIPVGAFEFRTVR